MVCGMAKRMVRLRGWSVAASRGRRIDLPIRAMALACMLALLASTALPGEPDSQPKPNGNSKAAKPDWDLLRLADREGEQLTRVRIVMYEFQLAGLYDYFDRDEQVEVETTNRLILEAMPELLRGSLRSARPGGGGAPTLGEILVTTNKRSFTIGITFHGFALGSAVPTAENTFRNAGLAILCDKILTDAGKQGISKVIRTSHLSPEGRVTADRFFWESMQARYNKASAEAREKGEY